MIIDTSALIAIARYEGEAELFLNLVASAKTVRVAAPTLVEFFIVADRSPDPAVRGRVDQVLDQLKLDVVAFSDEHAAIARRAHRDFGRGSGHPARLTMGDCFSYALAKATGEPLLYKGNDFAHTDIRSALEK